MAHELGKKGGFMEVNRVGLSVEEQTLSVSHNLAQFHARPQVVYTRIRTRPVSVKQWHARTNACTHTHAHILVRVHTPVQLDEPQGRQRAGWQEIRAEVTRAGER